MLFVGVESWYALGHQGFLEGHVPDQFLITIGNASVYNVAVLTIAFAYYKRHSQLDSKSPGQGGGSLGSAAFKHPAKIDRRKIEALDGIDRRSRSGSQYHLC
jgi:hypothetical protein